MAFGLVLLRSIELFMFCYKYNFLNCNFTTRTTIQYVERLSTNPKVVGSNLNLI